MNSNTVCSDNNLRILLREDEESDAFCRVAQHVEECSQCQTRLGELAAEQSDWNEAHEMLVSSHDAADQNGDHSTECLWNRKRWQRRPTAWTESMARQLLAPPSHPEMLGRIGRYGVERLIGAGGMGVVFKAFDTELNRPVAVKVLAPYLAGSGAARKRFAREARAAAAIVHEHVVAIHNVETDGESPFLVMQFVPGESLQCRLDREGPLEICEILRIGMQTAAGLAAAHAQGLVHRDVKPSNILLEKGVERTLLTDFGLARASDDASLTHTGYHPGTPQYMSPEQARGDAVDVRSDLFSLGSVIYAMCTGRPPFRAETSYGILRRITDNEPRPIREINPNIPQWLESIVAKLHAKSADHRFASAGEVHELLEQCLAHLQQPTTVSLPKSCSVSRAIRPSRLNSGWRRVLENRFARPALLILSIVVIAGALIAGRNFFSSETHQPQNAVNQDSTDSTPLTGNTLDLDPAIAWNTTANDIDSFRQDLAPLAMRFEQLWDDQPVNQQPHNTQE